MKLMAVRVATFLALSILLFAAPARPPTRAAAQGPIYQEDFEDGQAQGWNLDPGWKIIQDEGNQALAGQGHVWANSNIGYDDYRVTFRAKVLQGNFLVDYRVSNAERYFVDFQPDGSILHKQLSQDQFQDDLVSSGSPHPLNTWHQIAIDGKGGVIQFSVDGKTEWTYADPEPILHGVFAFESLENSVVYIDDVVVELADTSAYSPVPGTTPTGSPSWVRTGGPLGGLGYDVRAQPDHPDQMLVTDANAGVFISGDGGYSWTSSNEGITTRTGQTGDIIPIFCLTIDPADPNIVWAGTQEARGIFKSTDGGHTWEEKDHGILENQGITFRGISVDPANSDIVYAAAEISSYVWNNGQEKKGREFDMTAGVVYQTTDGGQSWTAIWRGDNLARYIWIDPRDTNVLYVSTGIFDREAKNSDPATGAPGGEGVLKSTDGGQTWERINDGLGNLYVGSLFMHPANPDILLAGTGNITYPRNNGAYLTLDGGAHWNHVLSGEIITAVEFAVSDPAIAYAAGPDRVFRSDDGGLTWKIATGRNEQDDSQAWGPAGIRGGFPIDLLVDPRNPDRIFANAYGGGNFLSEDGGKTWTDASRGYTGAQVRDIAVDPAHPGRVIAAARSGLFLSSDGGATWEGLNYPPMNRTEWTAVRFDPADPTHLVAGSNQDSVLAESRTTGSQWAIGFDIGGQKAGWKTLVFAPSDPAIVYAGTMNFYSAGVFDPSGPGRGIFRSSDGGKTWSPANDQNSEDANVLSLAVDPHDPDRVYAATSNHGLLMTADGGHSWRTVQGGLPADSASAVAINPADSNVIFAGFDRKSLYISVDGGVTWQTSVRGMMAEASFTAIVFDPLNPQTTVYAADQFNGVYRSVNAGETWELIKTGLSNRSINALAISSDGLHLYAASEGAGVFRLDLNGEPPAPAPDPTPTIQTDPVTNLPTDAGPAGSGALVPAPGSGPIHGLPCGSAALLLMVVTGLTRFWRRRSG